MTILWQKQDGSLAFTTLFPEAIEDMRSASLIAQNLGGRAAAERRRAELLAELSTIDDADEKAVCAEALGLLDAEIAKFRFHDQVKETIGITVAEHAALLQARGNIPADWIVLDYAAEDFPQDGSQQEDWRHINGKIVVDPACVKRRAFNAMVERINELERGAMLNRGTREMQLYQMEEKAAQVAAAKGISADSLLAANVYYSKLKALDNEIAALRELLA